MAKCKACEARKAKIKRLTAEAKAETKQEELDWQQEEEQRVQRGFDELSAYITLLCTEEKITIATKKAMDRSVFAIRDRLNELEGEVRAEAN